MLHDLLGDSVLLPFGQRSATLEICARRALFSRKSEGPPGTSLIIHAAPAETCRPLMSRQCRFKNPQMRKPWQGIVVIALPALRGIEPIVSGFTQRRQ